VENNQAPLLILHGLHDPYVPPEQSEELVEALKRAGKTYEYKTYVDEGHGILRQKKSFTTEKRRQTFGIYNYFTGSSGGDPPGQPACIIRNGHPDR
jgi:dipeptidyl aminopeptidase/acylaminoacyl peptidase